MPSPDPSLRPLRRLLVGATASGKSAVAERIAVESGGRVELISVDSMQVYRGLDVVTAKPTAEERARVPIACVDVVDPAESFSVAKYLEHAEDAERRIAARGNIALFVGGTPLYVKALIHGMFDGPAADEDVRARLVERAEREGDEALYAELLRVDPAAAARIHARDRKRTVRALEVYQLTGTRISELQRQWTESHGAPHVMAGLRVEKEQLHKRILKRIEAMFAAGAVEEVCRAAARGISREARGAVGVAEVLEYLEGRLTLGECHVAMAKRTRYLARRQSTWLRSFREVQWVDASDGRELDDVVREVKRALDL